jgi:TonB-dependent receptor
MHYLTCLFAPLCSFQRNGKTSPWFRGFFLAVLFSSGTFAQETATGTITGRVFNPFTSQYVRSAEVRVDRTSLVTYTESDGSYQLDNVKAGAVTLVVKYTGYENATAVIALEPGATATRDFDLKVKSDDGEVLLIEQYVVSAERVGNAKAMMDQRAALNAKSVVATDNFGHVAEGNVGEFIKYLPGVIMDNTEADARAPRLSGLDPKYASVSLDGQTMASAQSANFGGDTRQFEMEMLSINSIEAIEVNKTLTADMEASAPAGTVNMRSKNAFDRKGRMIAYNLSALANSYAMSFHKSVGPDNDKHLKIRPGFIFDVSDVFMNKRLGIQMTLSQSNGYQEQYRETVAYDFNGPPRVTSITWRPGPKLTQRSAIALNTDFKASSALTFSFRSAFSILNDDFNNRSFALITNRASLAADSSVNRVVANVNGTNTRLESGETRRNKVGETISLSPQFKYRGSGFTLNGGGSYNRSFVHYEDVKNGYFSQAPNRLTNISWMAERSSGNQTAWDVRQLSGPAWSDPANFRTTGNNTIRSTERDGWNERYSGNLDFTKPLTLVLPVQLKAGVKYTLDDRKLRAADRYYSYVGTPAYFPADTAYVFNPQKGGNVVDQGWKSPDRTGVHALFKTNPEFFAPDVNGNLTRQLQGPRDVQESIGAAYISGDTRWNRLRANLGLRFERTETQGQTIDPLPAAVITAQRPDLVANTPEYILYRHRYGQRETREGSYENFFVSANVKYAFAANLDAQLGFSQAIQRPNVDNLVGITTIDDVAQRVTVPNPTLKPEQSNKYFVGLQYYMEPASSFTIGGYVLDLTDMLEGRSNVTQEEAGYGDDPFYNGYTFSTYRNATDKRQLKGFEVSYSQQFTFLPKPFNGLSMFVTATRVVADSAIERHVPKAFTGGVGYRYAKFNLQLKSTWQSARLFDDRSALEKWYQKERFMIDLSSDYKLSQHLSLFVSGRNILNAPVIYYANEPGLLQRHDQYGVQWTFGVKGVF